MKQIIAEINVEKKLNHSNMIQSISGRQGKSSGKASLSKLHLSGDPSNKLGSTM